MSINAFAFAPAGVLGSGSVDVRPHGCVAVRPSLLGVGAGVQGTGVPFAAMARSRDAEVLAGVWGAVQATALSIASQHDPITKNDGTTLGIHSPGRPQS